MKARLEISAIGTLDTSSLADVSEVTPRRSTSQRSPLAVEEQNRVAFVLAVRFLTRLQVVLQIGRQFFANGHE